MTVVMTKVVWIWQFHLMSFRLHGNPHQVSFDIGGCTADKQTNCRKCKAILEPVKSSTQGWLVNKLFTHIIFRALAHTYTEIERFILNFQWIRWLLFFPKLLFNSRPKPQKFHSYGTDMVCTYCLCNDSATYMGLPIFFLTFFCQWLHELLLFIPQENSKLC